ncbi:hypothetical protein EYF80_027446 [Liparis tanakae]|uniref:Uncharacterized protein n=1 Tax=Liparis tanakae TaxID=230148 RepID=A0A4Z2H936_9TELE|nr:hypothetical protein EYF80_027446 [Liparis tanakae]
MRPMLSETLVMPSARLSGSPFTAWDTFLIELLRGFTNVLLVDAQCSGLQQPLGGAGLLLAIRLLAMHGLQLLLRRHPVALHREPEEELCLGPGGLHEVWNKGRTRVGVGLPSHSGEAILGFPKDTQMGGKVVHQASGKTGAQWTTRSYRSDDHTGGTRNQVLAQQSESSERVGLQNVSRLARPPLPQVKWTVQSTERTPWRSCIYRKSGNQRAARNCNKTWHRKSMYRPASFSVWILLSLSEGRVGMILRKDVNASLRDCVRCRSRMLAITRCVCRSSKESSGLLLASLSPLPALPPPLSQLFLHIFFPGLGLSMSPSSSSSSSARLRVARRFLAPLRGS